MNHHRIIKDNRQAELNLLEDIGMIDFATIDFLHHNFFKLRKLDGILASNKAEEMQLDTPKIDYKLHAMRDAHLKLSYSQGLKSIAEGKCKSKYLIILSMHYFCQC